MMTVTRCGSLISSDRSPVTAVSVGVDGWVLPALPGRTLTADQALGLVMTADALDGSSHPPAHPIWSDVASWIASVGLSPREVVLLLKLSVEPWQLPTTLIVARERPVPEPPPRRRPVRQVLGWATRRKEPK